MADYSATNDEDIRHDDLDFNPALEPRSAKAWINLLEESEKVFEDWHVHCDRIDKQFASLERLSGLARDKQYQMFWANIEVIKPSIYAKPPVPVVVPKFKDRRPVYQSAAEVMERCAVVAFDLAYINELMLQIRDDVAMIGRGVAWCRYETGYEKESYYGHEKVCIDFKNRRDFLHSISRSWAEVTWVAAASYLTRGEARKRFARRSGKAYQDAEYRVDKDSKEVGGADNRERAKFWEIWDRKTRRVVWVAKGCEDILDEDDPEFELRGFFPCPKPAYGALQRGSLVPVPDVMQYRDQLDEINILTARIHALADALEVKGFYPSGSTEIGDAVQAAIAHKSTGRVLVPVANWAAFGGTKDVIIWLPIDMIAQTVTALVTLRKEIIQDIYQIMGLSDIMRGATDPQETLGAQQLKTQYGSSRIRDKQYELVRLARDLVEICAEIICEKFDPVTIIEMSQTQLPTQQMVQQEVQQLVQQAQQQIQQATQNPQLMQQAQANPQQAQQLVQQKMAEVQQQIQQVQGRPTIEQVLRFLKDNKSRSFVLDIETDSTIIPDENAEKQRRTEFVQMLGGLLPQLSTMIQAEPSTAEFCGEILKFSVAPFRAGRSLDGTIDILVEQMKGRANGNAQREDPAVTKAKIEQQGEQAKLEAQKQKDQAELTLKAKEIDQKDQHKQWELQNARIIEAARLQAKDQDSEIKMGVANQKAMQDREAHQSHMLENDQKMALNAQAAQNKAREHQMRSTERMQASADRRAQQQFKATQPPAGRA